LSSWSPDDVLLHVSSCVSICYGRQSPPACFSTISCSSELPAQIQQFHFPH